MPSAETRAVRRAAVITHGKPETIGPGFQRLCAVAAECGVELVLPEEERAKHRVADGPGGDIADADIAVVLGGDGTMLRALNRLLGTSVPVIGVNFGRVGFLSSIRRDELEETLPRVFRGDYDVVELPTLVAEAGERRFAVNDVVVRSSDVGRMVQLSTAIGDEELARQPCDGIICATPSGSTAYNLSNGGPVLVWGLEAMAVTFVAPHSLDARPLVVPRGLVLTVWNRTPDVALTVILDGHEFTRLGLGESVRVHLNDRRTLLATLPEWTFLRRYRETFAS